MSYHEKYASIDLISGRSVVGSRRVSSLARDILPVCVEASPSVSKKAFLLSLLGVFVELPLIQPRGSEKGSHKDYEVKPWKTKISKLESSTGHGKCR